MTTQLSEQQVKERISIFSCPKCKGPLTEKVHMYKAESPMGDTVMATNPKVIAVFCKKCGYDLGSIS